MANNSAPLKIAIAGRPNVGKSTLLNRILGRRKAITEKTPGITRDKNESRASWQGYDFILVDTGGWTVNPKGLEKEVSQVALSAIKESDLVIMVVDIRSGLTADDSEMARAIKQIKKPVLLAANKVDDSSHKNEVWEFMALGIGDPFPVSSLHGRGVADLLDTAVKKLKEISALKSEEKPQDFLQGLQEDFSVAIVGRPNAGKSTLFNHLIGARRSIESALPGTTRDPVDTLLETSAGMIRFVDTAGMRRRSRMFGRAEYYSMLRALESVDRSDIALLVISAKEGITHQDQRLAERISSAGCPILVILNKWDLCSTQEKENLPMQVKDKLHFLPNAPLLRISALTGAGADKIIAILSETFQAYSRRVSTREINNAIARAQIEHSAPAGAKVLYAAQVAVDPPTFVFFVNKKLPATYIRYLERELRTAFDFGATPLKIRIKQRK